MFEHLPLGALLSVLTVALVTTFFVTSADSATFVLGMLTSNGSLNPPNKVKMTWAVILVASTSVLLYSGGLAGLQTAIIVSALPLTIIVLIMCYGIVKALQKDMKESVKTEVKSKNTISTKKESKTA